MEDSSRVRFDARMARRAALVAAAAAVAAAAVDLARLPDVGLAAGIAAAACGLGCCACLLLAVWSRRNR